MFAYYVRVHEPFETFNTYWKTLFNFDAISSDNKTTEISFNLLIFYGSSYKKKVFSVFHKTKVKFSMNP